MPLHPITVCVLAATVLVLTASSARAQVASGLWSAAVAIPAAARGQELHVNASGRGLLVSTGASGTLRAGRLVASLWSPDGTFATAGTFAPEHDIAAYGADHIFAPYAADHLVAAGVVDDRDGRVWIGTGRMGRPLDVTHPMPGAWHAVSVQTTANAAGDLATLAVACPSAHDEGCTRTRRLLLSVRRHGHPRKTSEIDAGYLRNQTALATNERGDLLVVYAKRDSKSRTHVYGRIRTLAGHWERRRDLGYSDYAGTLAAALGRVRRAAVIWTKQTVSECEPGSDNGVYAAAAGIGGHWTGDRQLATWGDVGCGHYVAVPGVDAAFSQDARRRAIIAWTARSPGQAGVFSVHSAVVTNGVIYSDHLVSDPAVDTVLSDLDATAAGQAAIVMTTNKAGADPAIAPGSSSPIGEHIIAAATAAMQTPFGSLEDVSTNAAGEVLDGAALAIDPVSTRALSAWSPITVAATVNTSIRTQIRPTP